MKREQEKRLVMNFSDTSAFVEAMAIEDIRRNGPAKAILSMQDVNEVSLKRRLPSETSGVAEMQRLFSKFRKR